MTVPNPIELARFGVSTDLIWRVRAEVSDYVDVTGTVVEDLKKSKEEKK